MVCSFLIICLFILLFLFSMVRTWKCTIRWVNSVLFISFRYCKCMLYDFWRIFGFAFRLFDLIRPHFYCCCGGSFCFFRLQFSFYLICIKYKQSVCVCAIHIKCIHNDGLRIKEKVSIRNLDSCHAFTLQPLPILFLYSFTFHLSVDHILHLYVYFIVEWQTYFAAP